MLEKDFTSPHLHGCGGCTQFESSHKMNDSAQTICPFVAGQYSSHSVREDRQIKNRDLDIPNLIGLIAVGQFKLMSEKMKKDLSRRFPTLITYNPIQETMRGHREMKLHLYKQHFKEQLGIVGYSLLQLFRSVPKSAT